MEKNDKVLYLKGLRADFLGDYENAFFFFSNMKSRSSNLERRYAKLALLIGEIDTAIKSYKKIFDNINFVLADEDDLGLLVLSIDSIRRNKLHETENYCELGASLRNSIHFGTFRLLLGATKSILYPDDVLEHTSYFSFSEKAIISEILGHIKEAADFYDQMLKSGIFSKRQLEIAFSFATRESISDLLSTINELDIYSHNNLVIRESSMNFHLLIKEILIESASSFKSYGFMEECIVYLRFASNIDSKDNRVKFYINTLLSDTFSKSSNVQTLKSIDEFYIHGKNEKKVIIPDRGKLALSSSDKEKSDKMLLSCEERLSLVLNKQYKGIDCLSTDALCKNISVECDNLPEKWIILFARAICQDKNGQWKEAKQSLEESINEGGGILVVNYLTYRKMQKGETFAGSLQLLLGFISDQEIDSSIADTVAFGYYLSGMYKEALPFSEMASTLLPDNPEVQEHLGDIYMSVGRCREAVFQWNKAFNLISHAKDRRNVKLKIDSNIECVKGIVKWG